MGTSKDHHGHSMIHALRLLILIVSILSMIYSIYMYLNTNSNLYYLIGGVSTVLTAFTSYLEVKAKKNTPMISSGENSTNLIINGNKNRTKIERGNNV